MVKGPKKLQEAARASLWREVETEGGKLGERLNRGRKEVRPCRGWEIKHRHHKIRGRKRPWERRPKPDAWWEEGLLGGCWSNDPEGKGLVNG